MVCLGLGSLFCISSDSTHGLFSCFEASCLYFTAFLEAMAKAVLETLQREPVSQLRRSDIRFLVYLGRWARSIQPSQAKPSQAQPIHTPSCPQTGTSPLSQILRVHHQWCKSQMGTPDNRARDLLINHKNFTFPLSQSVFIKPAPFDTAVFFRAAAAEKNKSSFSGPGSSEGPWELGRETAKFQKPSCEGGRTLLKCPFEKGASLLGLKCYLCYHPQ